eukprot:UN04457
MLTPHPLIIIQSSKSLILPLLSSSAIQIYFVCAFNLPPLFLLSGFYCLIRTTFSLFCFLPSLPNHHCVSFLTLSLSLLTRYSILTSTSHHIFLFP